MRRVRGCLIANVMTDGCQNNFNGHPNQNQVCGLASLQDSVSSLAAHEPGPCWSCPMRPIWNTWTCVESSPSPRNTGEVIFKIVVKCMVTVTRELVHWMLPANQAPRKPSTLCYYSNTLCAIKKVAYPGGRIPLIYLKFYRKPFGKKRGIKTRTGAFERNKIQLNRRSRT